MIRPKSYASWNSNGASSPAPPRHDADRDCSNTGLWERERLFAAMVDEVAAHGYEHTSVAAVSARAGLPEASFEANFADLETCFLETFESLVGQVYAHALSSYRAQREDWRASVRAAMSTLSHALFVHPAAARFCLLQARTVSPRAAARCDGAAALLEDSIALMFADAPEQPQPPPAILTAIAGGIWRVLEARLRGDLTEEPSELADRLLEVITAHLRRQPSPNGAAKHTENVARTRDRG